jgi:hypothetical protein
MTDFEKDLLQKIKIRLNNLSIDTDKIYVSDIRDIIRDLEKLEVSMTSESSLIMMGAIAQSLGDN